MKIYGIHSRFYDNGTIKAHTFEYESPEKPENKQIECRDYDAYFDYYTDKEEADKAYNDILKENGSISKRQQEAKI